jgi:hypothetical protein
MMCKNPSRPPSSNSSPKEMKKVGTPEAIQIVSRPRNHVSFRNLMPMKSHRTHSFDASLGETLWVDAAIDYLKGTVKVLLGGKSARKV